MASDTNLIYIKGMIGSKFNNSEVLILDQFNQQIWIKRQVLEKVGIKVKQGKHIRLETKSSNIRKSLSYKKAQD